MFIFNGVFTCEVHGGGGCIGYASYVPLNPPMQPVDYSSEFLWAFVCVFLNEKNSSLPHQIFSWKFYFYETKIILGRPALTSISLRVVAVVALPAVVVELHGVEQKGRVDARF